MYVCVIRHVLKEGGPPHRKLGICGMTLHDMTGDEGREKGTGMKGRSSLNILDRAVLQEARIINDMVNAVREDGPSFI